MSEGAVRDPGEGRSSAPRVVPPLYRLIVDTVESGASVPERRRPPAAYGIEARETVIGRDPAADIRLDDGFVSRRHAVFLLRDHELHLEDLASTNGTRYNGDLVETRIQVRPGDILEFGKALCRIQSAIPAPERVEEEEPEEEPEEDEERPGEPDPDADAAPPPWTLVGPIAGEPRRARLAALGAAAVLVVAIVLLFVALR